jgi:Protein of unknown function (DUF3106)
MNRRRQTLWWLAFCAAGRMLVFPAPAQNSPNLPPPVKSLVAPTNIMPPLPQSPVNIFRQLLTMTARERENYLTNRPPESRERILAKIREYLALDPDERELRLNATELRWYLLPLLRESPTNRDARLAQAPDNLRDLVRSRLEQWDALPPQFQQEFLDNERTLDYFSHMDPTNAAVAGQPSGPSDTEQARWNALSESERQKITAQFNQFFELKPDEKQKTLNTLSGTERAQMEKTLQSFDKLPPAQRAQCIRAFTQFAGMSPAERAEFLKSAERWSQLPPKERQAWRDLVAQVPLWPPVPHALIMPPMPPPLPPRPHPTLATNRN